MSRQPIAHKIRNAKVDFEQPDFADLTALGPYKLQRR